MATPTHQLQLPPCLASPWANYGELPQQTKQIRTVRSIVLSQVLHHRWVKQSPCLRSCRGASTPTNIKRPGREQSPRWKQAVGNSNTAPKVELISGTTTSITKTKSSSRLASTSSTKSFISPNSNTMARMAPRSIFLATNRRMWECMQPTN